MAQTVKHLSTMRETRVRSLGREDPLEKEMATHSSTLAWRIPWREEPGGVQSMGSQSRTRLSDFPFTFFHFHHLVGASPLPLDVGYLLWWNPTFSCQWLFSGELVAILEFSQEKMSARPSTLPSCIKL